MASFREVTATVFVSPQISVDDVARAAAEGFTAIVNNRPDGEAPDQPQAAEIEAAARRAGLAYAHVPVVGRPTAEQARLTGEALAAGGKGLAFCRSGTRSIFAWAIGELQAGRRGRDELLRLGAAAGYDLSSL